MAESNTDEPALKKAKINDEVSPMDNSTLSSPKPVSSTSVSSGVLKEADVGISCYLTSGFNPISGIIKQRFSDFVVNEIDMEGQIVKLTTTSADGNQGGGKAQQGKQAEGASDVCPIPQESLVELQSLVSEGNKKAVVKVTAPVEKDERRKIHMYIKSQFSNVCSNCVEVDGVKYIEFRLNSSHSNNDRRNRDERWPKNRPQHLQFTLYKEFKDTMEAIDIISKYSGIKAQQFNYAGTKDRRAKTSQQVTLFKVTADKLQKVNSKLRGMAVGNFTYVKKKLSLGQLSGNHFKVVLRNVKTTADNLSSATESLNTLGFVNYFGMQRFGTTSIPTYQVGLHILKGEFEQAVDLIMAPRDSDQPYAAEAKKLWRETRAADAVLRKLPKSFNIERRLMQGIAQHGLDKLPTALCAIPRTTRLLYLHSYQSLIWNTVVSRRIDEFGLKPMVGDLVYTKVVSPIQEVSADLASEQTESKDKPAVKTLTESELKDYTIYDIILPLPGYNVVLPDNKTGEWITEMLEGDNLTLSSLKGSGKNKEYRLPGSYRHLVVKPSNLSSSLVYYDDVMEELVQSDLDLLNNKVLTRKNSGSFQAAIFEFSLPSSCYATMLLREVMRADTSAAHQTSLNQT